jgi:alkylation response protein AidB-like acyl-CoA dehydrogenase
VRAVAAANASTARILDGHLNGLERLALLAPALLGEPDVLIGVWGADPTPSEGPPARIETRSSRPVLLGTKVFCSGAGGVTHALVTARDAAGERRLVYIDAREQLRIDRDWYRASGLRASESHRVTFDATPVLGVLGGPDELARDPYLARDAIRTAATWAGLTDAIFASAARALEHATDDLRLAMLGAMRVELATIDRWLEHAATELDSTTPSAKAAEVSLLCRVAMVDAARRIAEHAGRACGSRELIAGTTLDRARRDLDLFLLQHRLDAKLVGLGRGALPDGQP